MKTAEDFRRAAHDKQITEWRIVPCSLCGYQCGYLFNLDGDAVAYDAGCDCRSSAPQPRSWQSVADHYNLQATGGDARRRYDAFWGFNETSRQA